MARPFDFPGKQTLVFRTGTGLPTGSDFSMIADEST
jgi:hypothetical protein